MRREDNGPSDARFGTWLSTVGAYIRLMDNWEPQRHNVRTALVRATDNLPDETSTQGVRVRWRLPHDVVDVPGDHFTMVDEHAETTAKALDTWIDNLR
ncbi:hypothetical protein GCM10029964_055950 [Kibdelosporangium lantanae]